MNKRQRAKKELVEKMKKDEDGLFQRSEKVVVEAVPNPDIRCYHTKTEISLHPINMFNRPLRDTSGKYLEETGVVGATIVREALAIPGVVNITIQPYEISVRKGMAFSWSEIEPRVLGILERATI